MSKLADTQALLDEFLGQAAGLGQRLGCLLVQLPPSLAFAPHAASSFFDAMRQRHAGPLALEPRHATWFTPQVDGWLGERDVMRVLADPVRHDSGTTPGGAADRIYLRLHGSPRMHYSSSPPGLLQALARRIALAAQEGREVWCMFDNTAGSAATHNALELLQALKREGPSA